MNSARIASRLPVLLLVAVAAGVLVAGVAVPAVAGVGLAAKQSVVTFENLPADLKTPPLPQRSTILAGNGAYITSVYSENRVNVTSEQIPPVMRKSIVAIEDSRFYEHHGVDARGIVRAFVKNQQAGQVEQGASTLTQQYVKNVLLQSADTKEQQDAAIADTPARKLREARYAVALEQHLSKTEILTRYLNIALFGPGVYGVGTAATTYFGKPVSQLTLPEAAMLAGLVQNPSLYDPVRHPTVTLERRNTVLARMAQTGAISDADATAAEKTPLGLHRTATPNGCLSAKISAKFCSYVVQYLLADPTFGKTAAARQERLYEGGLTIKTSLSPKLQADSQKAVDQTYSSKSKYLGGQVVVQPGTGYVQAVTDTRPFTQDQNLYMTNATYQTGSTAKAFVLVAALEKGLPLTTSIYSPHDYTSHVFTSDGNTPYSISNDARGMHGTYDMRSAFAASVNTYYVQLEERTGVPAAVKAAEQMGVTNINGANGLAEYAKNDYGSFTLGAANISPLDMADAYATIAAKGVQCKPTPILSITDADGKAVSGGAKSCHQAIDPAVAAAAANAMTWPVNPQGPVINGATATGAAISGHTIAGKTGTTQDIKEAWFVGFSGQYAVASVVLDPKHKATLPGGDSSNRISVNAFHTFMSQALKGLPNVKFPKVEDKYLYGSSSDNNNDNQSYTVPSVVGESRSDATSQVSNAGLSWQIQHTNSNQPRGTVVSVSPGAGTQLSRGDTVTITVSDGPSTGGASTGLPPGTTNFPPNARPSKKCQPAGCTPRR